MEQVANCMRDSSATGLFNFTKKMKVETCDSSRRVITRTTARVAAAAELQETKSAVTLQDRLNALEPGVMRLMFVESTG